MEYVSLNISVIVADVCGIVNVCEDILPDQPSFCRKYAIFHKISLNFARSVNLDYTEEWFGMWDLYS